MANQLIAVAMLAVMRRWLREKFVERLAPSADVRQPIQLCLHMSDAFELNVERRAKIPISRLFA
jgi:hypothetical protein